MPLIRDFLPRHKKLKTFGEVGVIPMRFRQWTEFLGVVHHESGLDQLRLDQLTEKFVDELAPARAIEIWKFQVLGVVS